MLITNKDEAPKSVALEDRRKWTRREAEILLNAGLMMKRGISHSGYIDAAEVRDAIASAKLSIARLESEYERVDELIAYYRGEDELAHLRS